MIWDEYNHNNYIILHLAGYLFNLFKLIGIYTHNLYLYSN